MLKYTHTADILTEIKKATKGSRVKVKKLWYFASGTKAEVVDSLDGQKYEVQVRPISLRGK